MNFISEGIIDNVVDSYYSEDNLYLKNRDVFANEQAVFVALLEDEGYDILSDEEYELMWFTCTIIYSSAKKEHTIIPSVDQKAVELAEEKNWEVMENNMTGSFRDRVTPFFTNYSQEDLLAFVEDSLESDEDIEISGPGRELIFVTCKTLVDVLIGVA